MINTLCKYKQFYDFKVEYESTWWEGLLITGGIIAILVVLGLGFSFGIIGRIRENIRNFQVEFQRRVDAMKHKEMSEKI